MEESLKPKKRIFIALTGISAIFIALFVYALWKITIPGLNEINQYLPIAFGIVALILIVMLLTGVAGIVMALLGIPIMKLFYFWAWKAINIMFPLAVIFGRVFNIPREKIEQSFIEVSNNLVRQHLKKVPGNRIMILTPHCIQRDTCVHKITRSVENCKQCGGCSVGSMLALAHKYNCHFAVATGGTLARKMVKEARPKAIVAVACERDLTSGIQDVFPLPVLGVLNERPYGPCFNTRVDVNKLESAILEFMEEDIDGKN